MNRLLLIAVAAGFAFVGYEALWGDPASKSLILGYVAASLAAWGLSLARKDWAGRVKWAWIILSLLVAFSIVSGPLNYLRLG